MPERKDMFRSNPSVGPGVLEEHWAGDGDVLQNIQEILRFADEIIGSGMWKKVKNLLK